jgi:hypothetical protein
MRAQASHGIREAMTRRRSQRTFRRALVVCALALPVVAGPGGAARPPSRYPLDLDTAIAKAYPRTFAGIERSCTVWLANGRDEYALAVVSLRGGRTDVAGLQFVNTAGWFAMWRSHAPTAGVPKAQRATVTRLVREVAATCGARWTP